MINKKSAVYKKVLSGAAIALSAVLFSACSEAFWDSLDDGGYQQQAAFYGYVKKVKTVYYSKPAATSSNAAIGAVIGGMTGAVLTNGNGVGVLVGAGAGAAVGGAAAQVKDSDFVDSGTGPKATRLVIVKDNGDRVVIIQRFSRAFLPGDRVMVNTFRDGSVSVRRIRDDRYQPDDGGRRRHHHRDYDDRRDYDDSRYP